MAILLVIAVVRMYCCTQKKLKEIKETIDFFVTFFFYHWWHLNWGGGGTLLLLATPMVVDMLFTPL